MWYSKGYFWLQRLAYTTSMSLSALLGERRHTSPNLLDIPWEDVLYMYIFPMLPFQSLFQLRATSHRGLQCVSSYFQHMKVVDLSDVGPRFNLDTFQLLTKNNTVLRSLVLKHGAKAWLNEKKLLPVLRDNPGLSTVDFSNCTSIGNGCVQTLAETCKDNLRDLSLFECCWLSPEGALTLSTHCTALRRLDLTGCWQLTDDCIISLVSLCSQWVFRTHPHHIIPQLTHIPHLITTHMCTLLLICITVLLAGVERSLLFSGCSIYPSPKYMAWLIAV